MKIGYSNGVEGNVRWRNSFASVINLHFNQVKFLFDQKNISRGNRDFSVSREQVKFDQLIVTTNIYRQSKS